MRSAVANLRRASFRDSRSFKATKNNSLASYKALIWDSAGQEEHASAPVKSAAAGVASSATCTARTWLCARSRIQNYHNHVGCTWQTGGILDDLIAGQYDRARARAGLLIAAAEQASNWIVSTVGLWNKYHPIRFSKHAQEGSSPRARRPSHAHRPPLRRVATTSLAISPRASSPAVLAVASAAIQAAQILSRKEAAEVPGPDEIMGLWELSAVQARTIQAQTSALPTSQTAP